MRPMLYERMLAPHAFDHIVGTDKDRTMLVRLEDPFLDEVRADVVRANLESAKLAVVVDVQNVADYTEAEVQENQFQYCTHDGLQMPWPRTWLEWVQPASLPFGGMPIGALVRTVPIEDDYRAQWRIDSTIESERAIAEGPAHWVQMLDAYTEHLRKPGRSLYGPVASIAYPLDENGRMLLVTGEGGEPDRVSADLMVWPSFSRSQDTPPMLHGEMQLLNGCLVVAEFAARFANCKNVVALEEGLPRQAARRIFQVTGAPTVRHKVLVIDPMMSPRAGPGERKPVQGLLPRHIVRGHFGHYGDAYGRGKLFGRYEGRFWIAAHARGNKARGVIEKEYLERTAPGMAQNAI